MLRRIKHFFSWLLGLLFPPKCPSCGVFLKKHFWDAPSGVFCEKCEKEWVRAKRELCGRCGEGYARCACMPKLLGTTGIDGLLKLCSYEKARETVGKRSILYMKKHNSKKLFAFFGRELAAVVSEFLREEGKPEARVLVSYLPRSRKGVRLYGLDQSRLLAKQAAKALGADFSSVFSRKHKFLIREQKHLSPAERQKNMRSAFALAEAGAVRIAACDLFVIIDDVVTTGASLGGCIELLPSGERHKTLCVSVGVSPFVKKAQKRVAILQ